jgi:hypothetical protein
METARESTRRARCYILAYLYLEERGKQGSDVGGDQLLLHPDSEALTK